MDIIIFLIFFFIVFFGIVFYSLKNSNKYKILPNETIPEKYINFPVYYGKMSKRPKETISKNYTRLTLFYEGNPNEQYLDALYMAGFEKASDVRYERKDNTYVIFEKIGNYTKIAYHIRKETSNNVIDFN